MMTFKRNTLTFKCNDLIIIVVVVRLYKRNSIWIGYNVPVTITMRIKKVMILQLFILISGQIFKMFNTRKQKKHLKCC